MKKGIALAFVGFFGALLVLSTLGPATAQDPAGPESILYPSLLSTPTVTFTRGVETTAQPTEEAVFLGPLPSMPAEGTPTPETAGAKPDILPAEPRPVPEGQTVPQKEGLSTTGEIWVWTDRGCGSSAVYDPGDYITFYFRAAQSGSATLYYHKPDSTQVRWSGYMQANVTYYIPTQIDPSSLGGVRILRILMADELAQDYCGFSICGGGGKIYVWTNKGCDGLYHHGEPITIYIEAEQCGYAWLYDYWSDGYVQQISLGYLQAGVTYYLQGTVNEPEGLQVLRAIMPDAQAQDYCSLIVEEEVMPTCTPTRTPTRTPTPTATRTPTVTPTPTKVVKPWTLMFYFAADNNEDMEKIGQLERSRLQQASQNSNVNIVALWDGRALSDSRYEVFSPGGVTSIQKGELNTGDPNTLRDFVSWTQQNYSAAHYALIISDHGSGVNGAAVDNNTPWPNLLGDYLTPKEWRQALTGLAKLDILYMHACLMGTIESGYQLRGLVDYYVASESIAWGAMQADWFTNGYEKYGGRWDIIIPPIRGDTTPEQLATAMAKSYAGLIELHTSLPSSVSVVRLSNVENVATKASALAGLIKSRMSSLKQTLTTFYDPSVLQHFMSRWTILNGSDNEISRDDEYVDLKDFAEQVEAHISQSDIQDAARQLKAAIDSYVVYDKHWNGWTPKQHYWSHAKAHGVSIFFPKPGWRRSFGSCRPEGEILTK